MQRDVELLSACLSDCDLAVWHHYAAFPIFCFRLSSVPDIISGLPVSFLSLLKDASHSGRYVNEQSFSFSRGVSLTQE
jgi:hypothetical protein